MSINRVVIAGGGIGGLATAIGLAQKGIASLVLEKASTLGEIGAGIQLGPNAFHAFDYLGVGDQARAMAVYIDNLRLMDALSGAEVTRIPLDEAFRARFNNPYAVVHRGELHGVLLKACIAHPLVELRTNAAVAGYAQGGNGVEAVLQDGERVAGSLLIGADGLWSKVRAQMLGDGAPRVSGHTTYRSVIAREDMPEDLRWNDATLWAGPKCHIVHYPLSGGQSFNLVVTYHNDAAAPVAGLPVSHAEVAQGFEHVHPRARQIIERGQDWKLWVLCDRDPVMDWVDGRVALLGDAAHPQLQYFAQGACMALEDAVALAHCLDGAADKAAALVAYNDLRVLRAARIQLQSRAIGEHIYHPAGAHAALRNKVMSSRSAEQWYDQVAWLYGSTGIAGAVSTETLQLH
ncbi:3-hydroxybenzoate 6-monooxygenase [Pararhodobacter oceanensis]|uniref:3-hydroxybenzoate 6-monooxygenase n=1 Tax=Pararhodobacter oceanensis TaxID=2172121 RepID=A0A2T8HQY7_9RHOB|nr:3-hydroxybenzoate 6-monooxygenase [Pararhodobacter oceanensis]PVH27825.1 3-hydroxybenzoate 6-monooxygenase [Pararhodobacter oceanensis]